MGLRRCLSSGFTLVEILVAMTIFASVATLAFGAFRFAAREREDLARAVAAEITAGACLERMARDLSSLYIPLPPAFSPPEPDDPPSEFRFAGDTEDWGDQFIGELAFASLAHVSLEDPIRKGIARIGYYTQVAGEGSFVLRRSDRLYPHTVEEVAARDPILCENVKSLAFYYYGRNGQLSSRWDSASDESDYASPVGVKIILETDIDGKGQVLETTVALPVHRAPIE